MNLGLILAQLCRDKISESWDLYEELEGKEEYLQQQLEETQQELQTAREREKELEDDLDEARAVATTLQDELQQILRNYRVANSHSPYEMTLVRTDAEYIRALARNYRG
jgi:chromosome segregation ATPase